MIFQMCCRKWGASFLCGALLPLLAGVAHGEEAKRTDQAEVLLEEKGKNAVIGRWLAAGSGCEASSENPNTQSGVRFLIEPSAGAAGGPEEASEQKLDHGLPQVVRFVLPHFELKRFEKSEKYPKPNLIHYARECALRFNVSPPQGMRLSSVSAFSEFEATKPRGAQLVMNASLKVGATTVTSETLKFAEEGEFRFRRFPVELIPGRVPGSEVPKTACEEKKIVGVDLTFLTHKETDDQVVTARLSQASDVAIHVTFRACEEGPSF